MTSFQIGDEIQWESQGVDRFDKPKIITKIDELNGQFFVFVEDMTVGIPMEQIRLINHSRSYYGQWMVGYWDCENCGTGFYPSQLYTLKKKKPFTCPDCGEVLSYDEFE